MNSSRLLSRCLRGLAIPAALLLLLAVTSCRRDTAVRSALARAEAVMEENPREARLILDSIASPNPPLKGRASGHPAFRRGRGEASFALYALLRTQADYKCRVRLTSDSLPLIATRYYGMTHKTLRAALAQYYLGCAYSDMGRDLEAIDALLRAVTLFPDTTNKYYAYSQFELGKKYLDHEKDAEALDAFQHYYWSDACQSDSVNLGYADMFLGRVYLYQEQAEKAEPFFLNVIANPAMNKANHDYACFQLAKQYAFLNNDYIKAQPYIDQYIQGYRQKEKIGAAYFLKGEICFHKNELDSAFYYYNKVLGCEEEIHTYCETYKRLIEVAQALGKNDSTDVWFRHYVVLSDSVSKIRRDKEISDIENNHVVELHDRALAAHRSRLHWTWGILFTLLVLLSGLFVLLNDRKHKNERLRYEQQLKDIEHRYVQENTQKDDEESGEPALVPSVEDAPPASTSYFSLQENRLSLYREQYQKSKWPGYFISRQADIDANGYMPVDDSEQFLRYLGDLFVNMQVDLHRENALLNQHEIAFCCITMLGFGTDQIAYCCRKPIKYCYNRRTRLGERMTADWYQFVFGKPPRQS